MNYETRCSSFFAIPRESRNPLGFDTSMDYTEKTVEPDSIDLHDATFRLTGETRVDELARSIHAAGLINPPFLIRSASRFIVVAGFRRVCACRALGWTWMPARVLNPETDKLACTKLAIADNASVRNLNLVEESRAYAMLAGVLPNERDRAGAAAALGLSDNPARIKKIEAVCGLPLPLQEGIRNNTLSLTIALALGEFLPETAIRLANLFNHLKLSLNKQREIFLYIKEISIIENKPVAEVIDHPAIRHTLNDPDMDRTLKTRQIRTYLKQRRFPAISRAEHDFQQSLKRLRLGQGVQLIPPPGFESREYALSIRFRSLEELERRLKDLDKLARRPAMATILDRKPPEP